MKKLITLLFLALSTGVTLCAQDVLYFTYKGERLEDKATLIFNATEETYDLGNGSTYMEIQAKSNKEEDGLMVVNPTGNSITVTKGTFTVESRTATGSTIQWCIFDNCIPNENKVELIGKSLAANTTTKMELDGVFVHKNYGEMKTQTILKYGFKTITINVNFVYTEGSGMHTEHTAGMNTKVVNNEFVYAFDQASKRQLNLYNITGTLLRSHSLSHKGSVSLNDLSKGIYLYEVIENGKRIATHKCVIE